MGNNSMINVWDKISIHCLNHKEPIKMEILQNEEKFKSPFFACSGEGCPCSNRLGLDDYQGLILKLLSDFGGDDVIGADFTNYTTEFKNASHKTRIKVKILKYSNSDIKIGILNKTVLGIK